MLRRAASGKSGRQQRAPLPSGADALFVSEVSDCIAHLGLMRVNPPAGGVINAVSIAGSGGMAYGARNIGEPFPPNTLVLCYRPAQLPYAFVLGALPPWVVDGKNNQVPDWLVPACASGIASDKVHWAELSKGSVATGYINYAAGRPCDSLPGDYGAINELGVSCGIGRAMAWLRASHFCGVEAFWFDNLLRLTGYNLEEMTSGSERRATNDEGEFTDLFRWGMYPWETLGVSASKKAFVRKTEAKWQESNGQNEAGLEPEKLDQAGIWRVQRFRGYLGDGERTIVSLPVESAFTDGYNRMSEPVTLPGLLDVGFSPDGGYRIRSAKRIVFEKTVVLPVPHELKAPDDPTGDNPTNYKAAGVFGEGDEHTKAKVVHEDDSAGLRALMLFERHALLYSLNANLPFIRHKNDWQLPSETDVLEAFGLDSGLYQPSTELNVDDYRMPLPKLVELDIDHRETSKYYSGRAFQMIEEDGSILLEDAYGSQIHMAGGNIELCARNDIVLRPGRNVQMWAPHDIILKAGNSADLTASQGDVRLKAQGNLMAVAVDKGVLIESQASGDEPDWEQVGEDVDSRGVIIRAPESKITTLSQDAYFRSGVKEGFAGDVHVDASAGKAGGKVFVHGQTVVTRALEEIQTIVGSTGENDNTASLNMTPYTFSVSGQTLTDASFGVVNMTIGHEIYGRATLYLLGDEYITGRLSAEDGGTFGSAIYAQASLYMHGDILVTGSGIFNEWLLCKNIAADEGGSFLPKTKEDELAADIEVPPYPTYPQEQLDLAKERATTAWVDVREADNALVVELEELLYSDESVFAGLVITNKASFSYRTPAQYGTVDGFSWYETRWQQMGRVLFDNTTVWEEETLPAPHDESDGMPYPGEPAWTADESFITLDHKLFDMNKGVVSSDVESDSDQEVTMAEPTKTTFESGYVITLQKNRS